MKTCLICNEEFKVLGRHVSQHEGVTPQKYYDQYIKTNLGGSCKICNKPTAFINIVVGYKKYCSAKCSSNDPEVREKYKSTCLRKYGVENVSHSSVIVDKIVKSNKENNIEEVKEKRKQTMLLKYGYEHNMKDPKQIEALRLASMEKYGVDNPMKRIDVVRKVQLTCLDRYGVSNPLKSETIKDKVRDTNIERYGTEYGFQNEIIKEKIKSYNIKKYGVDNYTKTEECKEKVKNTNFSRYGVDNPSKHEGFKQKRQDTNLVRYGNEFYTKSDTYSNLVEDARKVKYNELDIGVKYISSTGTLVKFKCDVCLSEFDVTTTTLNIRIKHNECVCTVCNKLNKPISKLETKLGEFIKTVYIGDISFNDRSVLLGSELDIYLSDLKLAFEFNGLYWHNELHKDTNYHLNKTEACLSKGIKLIHIYEDDWLYKQDIVKSRIINLLGESEKLFARKCEIKEVSYDDTKIFLIDNHIQGNCNSKVRYGLYYKDELVSLMTFGKSRFEKGKTELLRFCNKLNTSVVGGASRLFKHYINNNEYTEIISYADRSWSNGKLYNNLGFKLIGKTEANYSYIIDGITHDRFVCRKSELVKQGFDDSKTEHEIMLERNIYRIYDSGSLKFNYK